MAIVEVKVPQLSESVAEATMLQWKKRPGETVERDEILIEIETDKVVLEVPAPASGVLAQVISQDGDTVVADQVIAKIDTEGQASNSPMEVRPVADATAAAPAPAAAAPVAAQAAAPASDTAKAMPSAAKLMAEQGLSAGQVPGTGRDGRITKGDVLQAATAPAAPAAKPAAPAVVAAAKPAAAKASLPDVKAPVNSDEWLEGRPEQRVPMSRLRARVAQRLL